MQRATFYLILALVFSISCNNHAFGAKVLDPGNSYIMEWNQKFLNFLYQELYSNICDSKHDVSSTFFVDGPYRDLGCFKDSYPIRAMGELEGDSRVISILDGLYTRRYDEVQKCYKAASFLGFKVFAVQDGGQCFSSATANATFDRYGRSTECLSDGAGGPMANQVYKINDGTSSSPGRGKRFQKIA